MFSITLNGMVYSFEDDRLMEIMDMLDDAAEKVREE